MMCRFSMIFLNDKGSYLFERKREKGKDTEIYTSYFIHKVCALF